MMGTGAGKVGGLTGVAKVGELSLSFGSLRSKKVQALETLEMNGRQQSSELRARLADIAWTSGVLPYRRDAAETRVMRPCSPHIPAVVICDEVLMIWTKSQLW